MCFQNNKKNTISLYNQIKNLVLPCWILKLRHTNKKNLFFYFEGGIRLREGDGYLKISSNINPFIAMIESECRVSLKLPKCKVAIISS